MAERAGRRWVSVARRVFFGLCAVYALWLAAVHVFLWTPLLRNLIRDHQDTVRVEYHFAWSLFPGTVHASGLVITVQDHMQQFRLAVDEVTARVVLGHLFERTFHADKVRAKGVTFAMRLRLGPNDLTQEALRGLPLIDGLPPLPLVEADVEDLVPDSRYKMFSVWLEDVRAEDVRTLWFDKLRLDGHATVAGAFYLKPIRQIYIEPARLELQAAALRDEGHPIADGIHGQFELRVGPVDPRHLTASGFARATSLTSDLDAGLLGLEFLGVKWGKGTLHAGAHVEKGRLMEGNLIEIALGETAFPPAKAKAESVRVRVDRTRARVAIDRVTAPGGSLKGARLELSGEAPDLGDLQLPRALSLDVEGGRIDDAARLTERLPPALRLLGGSGTFAAHLEGPANQGAGFFNLTLRQLAIDARNETFHADLAVNAKIAAFDPRRGADLSGTKISVDNGGIKREPRARTWWGRFQLPHAQLRLRKKELFDADLVADCRDARPIVGLYARLGSLPGSTKKLFTMEGLHVDGSLALGAGWLVLRDLHASGTGAEIRAVFRRQAEEEQGAIWLKVGIVPLAIGLGQNGGGLHIFGPGDFFTEKKAVLGRAPRLSPLRSNKPLHFRHRARKPQ